MENEAWKAAYGFEGLYEVSNFGRIRSIKRYVPSKNGSVRLVNSRILIVHRAYNGYLRVPMCRNAERKTVSVHRLVAETFIKNEFNKSFVNHIDGNKENNRVDNLEWVTPSENSKHALNHHLFVPKHGEDHPNSKLSSDDVKQIFYLYNSRKYTQREIGNMFGIGRTAISRILRKTRRKFESLDIKNPVMKRNGKTETGEKNSQAKLKNNEIRKIKMLYSSGIYTQKKIGDMFGVSNSEVSQIVNNKRWKNNH
ncbi:MAG: NUMOD4 domain-containing protein [Sporolactobacillus sp.]